MTERGPGCPLERSRILALLGGASGRSPLPRDAFDANGFQGQYMHVIPSRKLVVVRIGATTYRDHDREPLPLEVIEAMRRD